MIRLKRTGLRSDSAPEGARRGRGPHLRLVARESETSEDASQAEEEGDGRARRACSVAYEDPHAFVRTWVDPRNIYLA